MESIFSKNFKYLRKHKHLSQSELAEALKISRSKIASYEGRGVEPKLSLLVEIAKFFNVRIEDLIGVDIAQTVNESGGSSIKSFQISTSHNTTSTADSGTIHLNNTHSEALDTFLKESASIVKMLEGFRVFYKIKTDTIQADQLSIEEKRAHHDIQNVLFLIDYLLDHNKELITVLKNAQAA